MNETSPVLQDAIKAHTDYVAAIAERVPILLPLIRLLASGKPVEPEHLATVSHRSLEAIEAMVQSSDVEVDREGKIVGWGLTLRSTSHQFHLGEQTLYAWCAMDALILPALLGATAQVVSRCPATGKELRLTVTPEAIVNLEPASVVVSARPPMEAADPCKAREICLLGHFFASREAAASWPSLHPRAALLSIEEAARLGRMMARQTLSLEQEPEGHNQYSI
jgi:alkylmercury lyase